jgi:uncharacterized delta-60 repeat protein
MSLTRWLSDQVRLAPRHASRKKTAARRGFQPTLEPLDDRCMPSAGAFDPTFGTSGVATPPAATAHGITNTLAIYPGSPAATASDIAAAGYVWKGGYVEFGLARFTASDHADTTFDGDGEVTTTFKGYRSSEVYGLAVQGNGKLVAAGVASGSTAGGGVAFALARYNINGSLDATFGTKGEVTTNFSGSPTTPGNDYARAMFIQTDGKIVVAGTILPNTGTAVGIGLARYNSNGTLDTAFGAGGTVVIPHSAIPGSLVDPTYGRTWVGNAVVQSDGKILVAGYTMVNVVPYSYEAFVLRFNAYGTLDTNFGSSGAVVLPPQHLLIPSEGGVGQVAVEPNGEIVLTGLNQLALLHTDGSFDPAFGPNGIVPGGEGSVELEPNGDIVTASNPQNSGEVSRFHLADGSPDLTFGTGGAVVPFPGSAAGYLVTGFAVQTDGKIDVASGFDLVRLLPGEPQIGSFSAATTSGSINLTATSIADSNPGNTITQVSFYYLDSVGNRVSLGTATQSAAGTWSGTFTITLPAGTTLLAVAEDSYGVFGDPTTLVL